MAFQFDASGTVNMAGYGRPAGFASYIAWADLDAFTQGYIEAMFEGAAQDGGSVLMTLGAFYAFSDLAPETLARIIADCTSFQNIATGLGQKTAEAEGARFWNGRQGGLSGAFGAAFPPLTVQLGDDGKVHFKTLEA